MNMEEIKKARTEDYNKAVANIDPKDTFALYWAGSASASVLSDYKAGRVEVIKAAEKQRRKTNANLRKIRGL